MGLKVRIEDKLYLEHDGNNYVLKHYTGKWYLHNEGKPTEEERESYNVLGYYGTVRQALNKVMELKISQSTASNLADLITDINSVRSELDGIMKGETFDE